MKKINIDGTEYVIESDAQRVDYSGNVHGATNVKEALDALQHAVEIGGGAGNMSQYGYYGINFPKQMSLIKTVLDANTSSSHPRLRFVHISDSHGPNIGYADSLLENTAADFAAHTGDAVLGQYDYDGGFSTLISEMLACTKPFYLALGNHDCYKSPSLEARFTKYIQPLNEHNGLTGNTKTYYSVNYTKQSAKFKCIFLDQADAGPWNNTDTPTGWTIVKMSDEQVVWFIQELQEAQTNGRHVLIFLHTAPDTTTNRIFGWFDFDEPAIYDTGDLIMDIVNAFKTGGSYEYKGTTYSFSGNGTFVAYFCGHTHSDSYGYMAKYPNQFCCTTCRPYAQSDAGDGTFNSGYPQINYFTVDYQSRKLSLYRVGEQRTWQGTERVSFYIKY